MKVKHHGTGTPIYITWKAIKQRCLNLNNPAYKDYGGRGIKMCNRWLNSFENFFADMGEKPDGLELDRIDNDGDYEPNNCHWTTTKENNRNKRDIVLSVEKANKIRILKGKGLKLKDIAEKLNIQRHSISNVLYRNDWR